MASDYKVVFSIEFVSWQIRSALLLLLLLLLLTTQATAQRGSSGRETGNADGCAHVKWPHASRRRPTWRGEFCNVAEPREQCVTMLLEHLLGHMDSKYTSMHTALVAVHCGLVRPGHRVTSVAHEPCVEHPFSLGSSSSCPAACLHLCR
jgi:hypothetical protein